MLLSRIIKDNMHVFTGRRATNRTTEDTERIGIGELSLIPPHTPPHYSLSVFPNPIHYHNQAAKSTFQFQRAAGGWVAAVVHSSDGNATEGSNKHSLCNCLFISVSSLLITTSWAADVQNWGCWRSREILVLIKLIGCPLVLNTVTTSWTLIVKECSPGDTEVHQRWVKPAPGLSVCDIISLFSFVRSWRWPLNQEETTFSWKMFNRAGCAPPVGFLRPYFVTLDIGLVPVALVLFVYSFGLSNCPVRL